LARHGDRVCGGGFRCRRDRRSWFNARSAYRRRGRRVDPRAFDRIFSRIGGDRDLRHCDRGIDPPSGGAVREGAGMKAPLMVAVAGTAAFVLLPFILPPYYIGLMIPFFGYAIALLGFNLLFGYTGLLSFGHAMFLGIGAYGAAVMTGLGVKSFEVV